MRSTMILAPSRRAAFTASVIVASSVTPMTVTTSAPAFAAISTSRAPVSMTLRSATIVLPGQAPPRLRGGPPRLDPVRPARDGLLRGLDRALEVHEVEGDVQDGLHGDGR